ncbi:nuclear transport factor 2 family protein [Kibdelosporangium phytohabitans]|uniref:Ketosteroid isomerase n=1 Tax=Kibdelosporangium phytohabitans TaxID=860235 RepID=A0A0N9I824_9PSEU|nr:nuclear transport factor 2 family protein [Kibdelosporangium phytohabitans]ALG10781.1 ketosteroid isomerase [Kibdelosporangium phytohabitans]MBE1461941.1 ketosteroid isomerase-like protein [Kibdelosporangium phytohabitans]
MTNPQLIIQEHYAASGRGDLDGMVAAFAPDIEWTEMAGFPYAGTYRGVEEIREQVFGRLGGEWDGYEAVPEELVSVDDHVVVFGTYSGVFTATGKHMRARFVHHWTVRGGQVVRFEQFTDTHLVRAAMLVDDGE